MIQLQNRKYIEQSKTHLYNFDLPSISIMTELLYLKGSHQKHNTQSPKFQKYLILLRLSFSPKFLVIVINLNCLPCPKTRQLEDMTCPKLVSRKWWAVQNSSVKPTYLSKTCQIKMITQHIIVFRHCSLGHHFSLTSFG